MWCSTSHLFSDTHAWWIPIGSLTSCSDIPLCISNLFTAAPTSISDKIFVCVSMCVPHITDFLSLFGRVWGGILFLSAQCGWMLHRFKWRIVLCNLRDPANSASFEINSRDSCSDLAWMWRNTLFDQITKLQVLIVPLLLGCNVFLEKKTPDICLEYTIFCHLFAGALTQNEVQPDTNIRSKHLSCPRKIWTVTWIHCVNL